MTSLLLVRIDVTKLFPEFLRRLRLMIEEAELEYKSSYWAVSGFRPYGEQNELYEQGRTKSGPIVTNAKGGQSAHNFGIACDLALDGIVLRKGLQPDWRPQSYELLGILAPKYDLLWGGTWKNKDGPHIQMPGFVTVNELKPLRDRYESKGLTAVFDYLREQPQ